MNHQYMSSLPPTSGSPMHPQQEQIKCLSRGSSRQVPRRVSVQTNHQASISTSTNDPSFTNGQGFSLLSFQGQVGYSDEKKIDQLPSLIDSDGSSGSCSERFTALSKNEHVDGDSSFGGRWMADTNSNGISNVDRQSPFSLPNGIAQGYLNDDFDNMVDSRIDQDGLMSHITPFSDMAEFSESMVRNRANDDHLSASSRLASSLNEISDDNFGFSSQLMIGGESDITGDGQNPRLELSHHKQDDVRNMMIRRHQIRMNLLRQKRLAIRRRMLHIRSVRQIRHKRMMMVLAMRQKQKQFGMSTMSQWDQADDELNYSNDPNDFTPDAQGADEIIKYPSQISFHTPCCNREDPTNADDGVSALTDPVEISTSSSFKDTFSQRQRPVTFEPSHQVNTNTKSSCKQQIAYSV